MIITPLTKKGIKNLKVSWGYYTIYSLVKGNIISMADIQEKHVKYDEISKTYNVYITHNTSGVSNYWNTRSSDIPEGVFSEEELRKNYGVLKRVYKNGFKKEV